MKFKKSLCIGMILAISASSTAFGASFTDMNKLPWSGALEYINSVSDLGLMVGETDSSGKQVFRANDNVTYCEAIQLAYSVMLKSGQLGSYQSTKDKWKYVMNQYNIPEWAYEPVSYALENSVISVYDLSQFVDASGKSNYANREDVSVFFGKILSKTNSINSNAVLSFNDNSKISDDAKAYIDLLKRLEILVGDNNNNFNPTNNINRAEMAVIILKSYNSLKNQSTSGTGNTTGNTGSENSNQQNNSSQTVSEITGTITGIETFGSNKIISVSLNGSVQGYIASTETSVYYKNGESATISSVNVGDIVTLKSIGSKINSLTITSSSTTTVSGEIDEVTSSRFYFDDESIGYYFSNDVVITIDGSSSSVKGLMDALDDDYVVDATVTLNSNGEAIKIVAETDEDDDDLEGTIYSISSSKITIKKSSSSKSTYYFVDDEDDLTVRIDGSTEDLDELMDVFDDYGEDSIDVTLTINDDDEIEKVVAYTDDDDDDTVKGTIIDVTSSKIKIEKSSSSSTKNYYFVDDEDDLTIKIDGSTEDLDELMDVFDDYGEDNIDVTLTLNDDDEVEKVVAYTDDDDDDDDDDDEVDGKISSITTERVKLKGKSTTYYIEDEDDVTVKVYDGTKESKITDIDDLIDAVDDDKVFEVTLYVDDDDDISKITGDIYSAEGELFTINENSQYIKILTDSGYYSYEYEDEDDLDIDIDGDSSDLDDLIDVLDDDDYDTIDIVLSFDDNYITDIEVTTD